MDGKKLEILIKDRIAEDKRELAALNKRLSRAVEGNVVVRHKGSSELCYVVRKDPVTGKRLETYIPYKNEKKLIECYNKRYCLELKPVLEEEITVLEDFLQRFHPENKYSVRDIIPQRLVPRFQPVAVPQKEKCREWAHADYTRNSFPLDETNKYASEKGDFVRSRAECLAANILYNLDIDYRYECVLYLNGKHCIFPDFTIMHPETGELWFVEIFGMMGNAEYALEAFHRINEYRKSQYTDRVLFFFDYPGAPFDPDAFKSVVQKVFLA